MIGPVERDHSLDETAHDGETMCKISLPGLDVLLDGMRKANEISTGGKHIALAGDQDAAYRRIRLRGLEKARQHR